MKCQLAIRVFVFFLNRTPHVHDMLEGWQKSLQFDLEGEAPFHVVFDGRRARVVAGVSISPDVVFTAPAALFLKMMLDTAMADEAYVNRKYEVLGAPADATRFRVLGERVQHHHPVVFGLLKKVGPVVMRVS